MKIKIYDYIIRDETQAISRFNLYQEVISAKGKVREKTIANAIPLSKIMNLIAEKRVIDKDFTDLKEFVKQKELEIAMLIEFFDQKKYSVTELKKEVKKE